MGTIGITFFLHTAFYIRKMDDELTSRRSGAKSIDEKRWSMNSQRLEQIVAEVMKPVHDLRASFNLDQSALLEEYLTEAGLRALEEEEEDGGEEEEDGGSAGRPAEAPINFPELALLLQHSAFAYGRKVDLLYLDVLNMSQSLHNSTGDGEGEEEEGAGGAGAAGEAGEASGARRRRRPAPEALPFAEIELEACPGASRGAPGAARGGAGASARPPPTLPRAHVELEPRRLQPWDRPLEDYQREPIGVFQDFRVLSRLQDGMLMEDLAQWEGGPGSEEGQLKPIPLMELQAALQAAAPPPLPQTDPDPDPGSGVDSDNELPESGCGSPLPVPVPVPVPPPPDPAPRKRAARPDAAAGRPADRIQFLIPEEMKCAEREFGVPAAWARRVLRRRRDDILLRRGKLTAPAELRGFYRDAPDVGGLCGFSSAESSGAEAAWAAWRRRWAGGARRRRDSSDDGFFEGGSSAGSPGGPDPRPTEEADLEEWQRRVVGAAGTCEARGLDVKKLAKQLLDVLLLYDGEAEAEGEASQASACAEVVANLSVDSGVSLGADSDASGVAGGADAPTCGADATADAAAGKAPLRCRQLFAKAAKNPVELPGLFLSTLFLANSENVEIVQGEPLSLNSFSVRLLSADPERLAAATLDNPATAPGHPADP